MRWAPICLCLIAAGCGNAPGLEEELAQTLAGAVSGSDGASATEVAEGQPIPAALGLGAAQLAGIGRPLLFAEMQPEGLVAGLVEQARNGPYVTWITQDDVAVTERGGIVTATRGLPGDLLSADVGEVAAALRAGGGTARRVHRYLDEPRQTSMRAWKCRITGQGSELVPLPGGERRLTRLAERCTGADGSFANTYWMASGTIWQSEQRVGPGRRVMRLQRFRP